MHRLFIVFIVLLSCSNSLKSANYSYDLKDQLMQTVTENGLIIDYSYDSMGNRVSMVVTSPAPAAPELQIQYQNEYLVLQWDQVLGATNYRILSASLPSGPWITTATVTGTTWSTESTLGVRLFRVIAGN